MKQKLYRWFIVLLKNALAFLAGGALGVLTTILFAEPLIRRSVHADVGLGIIAAAPVLFILYALLLGITGGVIGVIVYNVVRVHRARSASQ